MLKFVVVNKPNDSLGEYNIPFYRPEITGDKTIKLEDIKIRPLDERKVCGRRSAMELHKCYVLEQLGMNVTCRPMMCEYLLYYDGVLFGGIYDDRFLVKIVDCNSKYGMCEAIPYEGARTMYLVDIDNYELLKDIVLDTCNGLKNNFFFEGYFIMNKFYSFIFFIIESLYYYIKYF